MSFIECYNCKNRFQSCKGIESEIYLNNNNVCIKFGYGSIFDGDIYIFIDGYYYEEDKRYIKYLSLYEFNIKYNDWINKSICDKCVDSLVYSRNLKMLSGHNWYIRYPGVFCDLCGFQSISNKCCKGFFSDNFKCDKNCKHENCICCVVYGNVVEHVNTCTFDPWTQKCKPERFILNKDNSLLSSNMDICRDCIQKLIDDNILQLLQQSQ